MAGEFRSELIKLTEGSGKSVSANKIQALTKIAIKYANESDEILEALEKFCASCESCYKLHALYVIDSICKASHAKLGECDPYTRAVSERLVEIFEHLVHYAPKDADKIRHVLDVWREKQVFSTELMDQLDQLNIVSRGRVRQDDEKSGKRENGGDILHTDVLGFDYGEEEEHIDEEEKRKLAELQKRIIEVGSKATVKTTTTATIVKGSEEEDPIVTVYSRTVCLDHVSKEFTESQLRDLCIYYGPVDQFHYFPDRQCVFVKYMMRSSVEGAKAALMGYEAFGMSMKTRWVCTLGRSNRFNFSTGILIAPKSSFQSVEWDILNGCEATGYVCEEPHRSIRTSSSQ
jgi:hypothetical protein